MLVLKLGIRTIVKVHVEVMPQRDGEIIIQSLGFFVDMMGVRTLCPRHNARAFSYPIKVALAFESDGL